LWRGLAEVAEKYVTKGRQLYIEGRIRTRSYDDQNGVKKYVTEIYGDTMQMLGNKEGSDAKPQGGAKNTMPEFPTATVNEPEMGGPEGDEDLPF